MARTGASIGTRASLGLGLVLALALLALAPAVSQAAVAGSMAIEIPQAIGVGQSAPATLNLRNLNTGMDGPTPNTVCNAGEEGPCSGDPGIVLTASCGALAAAQCSAPDPGVFGFSATGSGRAGTSCEGMTFAIAGVDPDLGTVRFTPDGGGHVVLPKTGSTCSIGFTLSGQRMPSVDFGPAPGVQTAQAGEHTQVGSATFALVKVRDTSSGITVRRAPVTLATTISGDITLGAGSLSADTTVNGRVSPVEGATIDFSLYGPDDATCTRAPVFTSQVAYPAAGGLVSSAAFRPAAAGSYRWSASYSGDANNLPVTGACSVSATIVGSGADRDRDGVPSARDECSSVAGACSVPAPLVGADRDRDGVPNDRDQCSSVAGDSRNGCPSELGANIRGVWRVNQLLSKLVSLTVNAPPGSRIEVRCKARPRVCPFKSKVIKKTTKRTTGMTRLFGRSRIYPSGTRFEVFVTKSRRRGTYERVLTRTGRRLPSVANRCLNARMDVQLCP